MELLQKNRINFLKLFKYPEQFLVILTNEFVATEAGPSVYDEIVLFLIENVIFIFICILFLESVSDNQSHETKWQAQVLVKKHPIMINIINSMTFIDSKPTFNVQFIFLLVDLRHIVWLQFDVLLAKYNVVLLCDVAFTKGIKEDFTIIRCIKRVFFNSLDHIPCYNALLVGRLLNLDNS